jgi:CRP/FNR family cyclic AMP-dependent transcriptional regulator
MDTTIAKYFEGEGYGQKIDTIAYKKGEVILRPHDDSSHIFAIVKGLVKIFNIDSRNKEYIAVIYGPGDFYPLAWLIDQSRPPVYFQAITDCEVHIVPRKMFQKHLKDNAELSNSFMNRVIEQFAYYATSINNLGLKYGKERLYYKLLVLSSRFGKKKDGAIIIPHISHSDLGVTIRMSREGVNKEIAKLEKLGVVEYSRANIKVNDIEFLQKELGESIPIAFFNNI